LFWNIHLDGGIQTINLKCGISEGNECNKYYVLIIWIKQKGKYWMCGGCVWERERWNRAVSSCNIIWTVIVGLSD
jgi:hypothetical protein